MMHIVYMITVKRKCAVIIHVFFLLMKDMQQNKKNIYVVYFEVKGR